MTATYEIVWMRRCHLPQVLEIEALAFDDPWTEADFIKALQQRYCIGMVAKAGEQVVGFMVYELGKASIRILNFAAAIERHGVGRAMVEELKKKLSIHWRRRLTLDIRESNLNGQKFWQAMDFQATTILHRFFSNGEDAYHMVFSLKPAKSIIDTPPSAAVGCTADMDTD